MSIRLWGLLVLLFAVAGCSPKGQEAHKLGASTAAPPPIFQASWQTPAWYIDPANSTGVAADTNNCTSASTPCKTWAGVVAYLGTLSPRLRQTTTITFLSSHTDDSDPVVFKPYLEHGVSAFIQGQLPAPAFSGTLASVTAKNRATNTLLSANLGATASVGQLIVNTTHPSRALVYANVSGTTYTITQPMAAAAVPAWSTTEVDTWANGDAFSVYSLPAVNVVDFEPTFVDFNGPYNNAGVVYQINGLDTGAIGTPNFGTLTVSPSVLIIESTMQRTVALNAAWRGWAPTYENVGFRGGVFAYGNGNEFQRTNIDAGFVLAVFNIPSVFRDSSVGLDVILGGGAAHVIENGGVTNMAIDTGASVIVRGTVDGSSGTPAFYGAGSINMQGRMKYAAGAGAAAAAFKLAGGIQIHGQTKACLIAPGSASGFGTCNLALTAAQLDTSLGATTGCLSDGTAAFCNYGP